MARQTFFSFHYNDIWRANVVRNSQTVKGATDEVGYYDHSLWEEAKTQGDAAIQRLINDGLNGASVTVVLVGAETSQRKWVRYEISKSHADGKGLLAINLQNIRDRYGYQGTLGPSPLGEFYVPEPFGGRRYLSEMWSTYDWIKDDGYSNVGNWIEAAARQAGR